MVNKREPFRRFAKERDVVSKLVRDYLEDNNKPPDFLFGIVRKIVTHADPVHTSNDPFYSVEDNKQRIVEGGKMKRPKDRKYAFVEIPDFFEPHGPVDTLLRVEISKDAEEKRKILLNEFIKIKFRTPQTYENPIFDGFPKKEPEFAIT